MSLALWESIKSSQHLYLLYTPCSAVLKSKYVFDYQLYYVFTTSFIPETRSTLKKDIRNLIEDVLFTRISSGGLNVDLVVSRHCKTINPTGYL